MRKITAPLTKAVRTRLKCGEHVLLTGTIYTARDMVHKRLKELVDRKKRLPLELKNTVIYYCGPTPQGPGGYFGSCGPTTSSRMDSFTPALLQKGLAGMIGKGSRSKDVRDMIKKRRAVYFLAVGGAGAYLAKKIISASTHAYAELGAEAIYKLKVKNFPLIVGIDSRGKDIYEKR